MRLIDADSFREWLIKQKRISKYYTLMILDEEPTIQPQGIDKDRLLEKLGRLNQWTQFAEHWFKVEEVYALIKSQPTTDGWIPVSSGKLPTKEDYSEDGFVLVQTGGDIIYKGLYDDESGFWVDEVGFAVSPLPIAWQPLPPAYKE